MEKAYTQLQLHLIWYNSIKSIYQHPAMVRDSCQDRKQCKVKEGNIYLIILCIRKKQDRN